MNDSEHAAGPESQGETDDFDSFSFVWARHAATSLYGAHFDPALHYIYLADHQDQRVYARTVAHEMAHAVLSATSPLALIADTMAALAQILTMRLLDRITVSLDDRARDLLGETPTSDLLDQSWAPRDALYESVRRAVRQPSVAWR